MFDKKDYIDTETGVLSTDLYNLELRHLNVMNGAKRPIYFNAVVVLVLTLILIASDAVTLFSAFEKVLLKDSAPLLYSVVIISAAALELLPILVSIILRKMELDKRDKKPRNPIYVALCVICLTAFLCVFAFSANVRWATQDLVVNVKDITPTSASDLMNSTATINLNAETGVQMKHIRSVTLMLMVLPFLTSCISFGLSYFSFDPVSEMDFEKSKHRVVLMSYKPRLTTAEKTLQGTVYTGQELDSFEQAANANTDAYSNVAKSIANEVLAEKIATSEGLDKCCK